MESRGIGTIILTGVDAVCFANSLFRPTVEEIERTSRILEDINRRVEIRRNSNGYEAKIENLDLSFLDDLLMDNQLNIVTTYIVQKSDILYENVESENFHRGIAGNDREMEVPGLIIKENEETRYNNGINEQYLYMAA